MKNIRNPKIGDTVFLRSNHSSVRKNKPYVIKDLENNHIWITCDDGVDRRGTYDLFYSSKVEINKNSNII